MNEDQIGGECSSHERYAEKWKEEDTWKAYE